MSKLNHDVVIFKSDKFTVTSYGNGLAYSVVASDGRDFFVQGDEALRFHDEIESLSDHAGMSYDEIYDYLISA